MTNDDAASDRDDVDGESTVDAAEVLPVSPSYKVRGRIDDPDGIGVLGENTADTGTPTGVKGTVPNASDGYGLSTPDDVRVSGALDTDGTDFVVEANYAATSDATNVVMGHVENTATSGVYGAVISGGGSVQDDMSGTDINENRVTARYGTIGGGESNTVSSGYGTVGGGLGNEAADEKATVGGGSMNNASGNNATIAGGSNNVTNGNKAAIGGGASNIARQEASTVGGGLDNLADDRLSTICGGKNNAACKSSATVGGGKNNTADANYSVVSGGRENTTSSGHESTVIGGGQSNATKAALASVGGGNENTAFGSYSTVAGGQNNRTGSTSESGKGQWATVPGGRDSAAEGDYSFAAGRLANATNQGAFIWGDSSNTSISSSTSNEVKVQAGGGAVVYSKSDKSTGVVLFQGDGSWSSVSSRTAKTDVRPTDPEAVLDGVERLPVNRWRYEGNEEAVHMGPMAEQFHSEFGLGQDEEHITGIDADGVALAAIKGLSKRLDETRAELEAKADRIDELEAKADRIDELEAENRVLRERLAAVETNLELDDTPPSTDD